MEPQLRNIKDFLTLYNKVTELCFGRCVDNLNDRSLAQHEDACVEKCVTKFARFNQHMMSVYVEVQTEINAKRMQELQDHPELLQPGGTQQAPNTVIGGVSREIPTGASLPA